MIDFKLGLLEQVWEKACSIPGMDPTLFRRDYHGAVIRKTEFNNEASIYGWCFHHLTPVWEGGSSDLGNVAPLNCTNKLQTLAGCINGWLQGAETWD